MQVGKVESIFGNCKYLIDSSIGYKWAVKGHVTRKESWIFIGKTFKCQALEFGLQSTIMGVTEVSLTGKHMIKAVHWGGEHRKVLWVAME